LLTIKPLFTICNKKFPFQGILRHNFYTVNAQGQGSANPIASNATAEGREQNRRVEISIYAIQ
jgi:outer membrane protein OmpA-like peptidoglycan-associated protein